MIMAYSSIFYRVGSFIFIPVSGQQHVQCKWRDLGQKRKGSRAHLLSCCLVLFVIPVNLSSNDSKYLSEPQVLSWSLSPGLSALP